MSQKSILEQALLQVETLEEAVKQNAKGILASTMKQELKKMLKEQEDEDELDTDENPANPDEEEDVPGDTDDTEITDTPEDESGEFGGEDVSDSTEDEPVDDELPGEETMDDEDSEDVLDMTGASEDEVLKVFKAMKPDDGIVVKKEGNKVEFSDGDNDYIIKLNEQEEYGLGDEEIGIDDEVADTDETGDEAIYEITLDEEDETCADDEAVEGEVEEETNLKKFGGKGTAKDKGKVEANPTGKPAFMAGKPQASDAKKEVKGQQGEFTEAARTKANIHGDKNGQNRTGLKSKTVFKAGSKSINEEVETLRKQNAEYKKALLLFKDKLNEVAVFNANLAYATRLFTESTTTKQEKLNILQRFDAVSTITESKNLYAQIKTELSVKKPVTEAVAEKIALTPTRSSTEVLSEAKAYENPQFKRMKELMGVKIK